MEIQRLCRFCSYRRAWLRNYDGVSLMKGIPLNDLLESSTNCTSCMAFNEALRERIKSLYTIGESGNIPLDIHLRSTEEAKETSKRDFGFFSSFIEQDPATAHLFQWDMDYFIKDLDTWEGLDPIYPGLTPSGAPSEDMPFFGLESLRCCYEACIVEHSACQQDINPEFLPTRLIDTVEMRLTRSSSLFRHSEDRRYVALSHQWGKAYFFKLTKRTEQEIKRDGLFIGRLRRTFQDAIRFTRKLGIRYLWIDSLCIIQGDKGESEWHREAALMADVYRNAAVTIAASDATELEDGFLGKAPEAHPLLTIESGHEHLTGAELLVTLNRDRALDRRGWVVQEHLLAPRTIHFSNPIVWECRKMTAKSTCNRLSIFPSISTRKIWTSKVREGDGYELWKQTVERYSNCLLSVPSDKLVAIGGLARVLAAALDWEYIAGHWRQSIIPSLLWETATVDCYRPECYRAPSWSWASIEGRIKFLATPKEFCPLAEVLDAEALPLQLDPFGELSRASLRIKCHLISLGIINPKQLVYNDIYLRVSLDALHTAHLYLMPLIKIYHEDQYLSLLLKRNVAAESSKEKEFQRLGVMATYLNGRDEINPGLRALPMNWTWWSNAFYCRETPNGAVRAFKAEDFEGGPMQEIELV